MSYRRKSRRKVEKDHNRNRINTVERKSTGIRIKLDNFFKKNAFVKETTLRRIKTFGKNAANGEVDLLSVFLMPRGRVLSGVTVPGSESMLSGDLGIKIFKVSL